MSSFPQAEVFEVPAEVKKKALVSELSLQFYKLGWLSGTGGSVTLKVHEHNVPRQNQFIVMLPSNVQKDRMSPEDMYVLSSMSPPPTKTYPHNPPKCTDCAPLFLKVYEMCNAGAVIQSHGLDACFVTMINSSSNEFRIRNMEMIKGIQGHGYHDELVVPIIENALSEGKLVESPTKAIRAYPKSTAVLVRRHGVFIWGDSWISAKTQAICYHYLAAAIKFHQLGLPY
ncbi:probable bifunctional methylthioribulose-1-phosphate dehydratase/enolase-phosphatase E1 [Coffea eugenioides]|uniref:probable bifunctional methylthioribulose-1-phosphate dehydratase/enolase-phosphatase E1 n=1 Tax=Coffea eugenioides TaxID=49369 RepID=UPI000F614758|nr:probable bifunctional methylthioribulose-1-phosphate dehydratase/enolase-phosphatase E1 [Coffea eugenioides]